MAVAMGRRDARPMAGAVVVTAAVAAVLLYSGAWQAHALDNGLGLTPAMGYNTWNDFRCNNINAKNIMAVADKMADLKLPQYGYEYLNIDDCWATGRNSTTHRLIPDPKAFPDGMKAVADYVHSKGLKFGIYSDRGTKTCAGRPASHGYEEVDAQTFADWGVDYLKEDSCHATPIHQEAFKEYGKMRDALNKTGRPIYFSLCGWNAWYAPVGWSLGNSWRINGDVNTWGSAYSAIRVNEALYNYSRPGGWNDPDMLVGSSPRAAVHLTPQQSRTQFSLWSVMAAPLLIGSNMLNLPSYDVETYTNEEVIAIDQDPLGYQGRPVFSTCPSFTMHDVHRLRRSGSMEPAAIPSCQQVWAKKLSTGAVAVNMVNYDKSNATITCNEACISAMGLSGEVLVRDVWQHKDLGTFTSFSAAVGGDGDSATLVFSKQ